MDPLADNTFMAAFADSHRLFHNEKEDYVDELLKGKDEINKTDIMSRLDQFSCKEELERYVEKAEEYRFRIMS